MISFDLDLNGDFDLEPASKVNEISAKLPTEPAKVPTDWGKRPPPSAETHFLRGPQRRGLELMRVIQIIFEIVKGFRTLHFVGPCVTVFGSARFREDQPHYRLAREVGVRLAQAGFTVMTGGGPGIMEAANRGARMPAVIQWVATLNFPKSSNRIPTSIAG